MEQFIDEVSGQVRTSRRRRDIIARELRSHYEESRRELEAAGWIADDAAREGITRLGNPDEIGQAFDRVYRPRRRSQISLAFILAGALVLGMFGISGSLASANAGHHAHRVQAHSAPHK